MSNIFLRSVRVQTLLAKGKGNTTVREVVYLFLTFPRKILREADNCIDYNTFYFNWFQNVAVFAGENSLGLEKAPYIIA